MTIEFHDDGAGLQIDKIKQLGEARQLIKQNNDAQEIAQLIFSDGFSTAEGVSQISGRGVGMGAIKKYVEDCGGSLDIQLKQATAPALQNSPQISFVLKLDASKYFRHS